MRPRILALDLEGTLISNAVSQIPRPGLCNFLEHAATTFDEVVLFTTVPKHLALRIVLLLAEEAHVPLWFTEVRYVEWTGSTKDLRFVSPLLGQALLLDDHRSYIHPDQHRFWIEAPLFASPYPANDSGLQVCQTRIRERVSLLAAIA
ncbi:NIF family HAD-type phosphatase [Stenotrophomonas sp.]|uniref:NIF family HAD-type phosphatase n=1 Tax=Stenotrophomonas sp. TaxID=69392 RepID=UPI0022094383|nr:NIF family HAD-type phosphatase [Stenotrophomonas sp.]UUS15979.1 NIF family HAD-type phosphatase [Stenotrophomonas sp. CD2]